ALTPAEVNVMRSGCCESAWAPIARPNTWATNHITMRLTSGNATRSATRTRILLIRTSERGSGHCPEWDAEVIGHNRAGDENSVGWGCRSPGAPIGRPLAGNGGLFGLFCGPK